MWSDESSDDDSVASSDAGSVAETSDNGQPDATEVLHEDPWNPTIRTSLVPMVLPVTQAVTQAVAQPVALKPSSGTSVAKMKMRSLMCATEPPRTGISPHGFTFKTWLYNFKKAVAAGNGAHVSYCLGSYFIWFQATELLGDSGVVRLLPIKNQSLWTQLQEQACAGGVLNNRWSAFLHQQLHLAIFDVFLEVIGICGAPLFSRLQDLWAQYELSLLSIPERSLSKLLTVGLLLTRAVKSGAVFFASAVFGHTAKARKKRAQVIKNPHVVRSSVPGDIAESVLDVLNDINPTTYTQRQKKHLYREWYLAHEDDTILDLPNLVQLLQSLPANEKKIFKVLARHKEVAQRPSTRQTIGHVQRLYTKLCQEPNALACSRFVHYILQQLVVYSHLLALQDLRGLVPVNPTDTAEEVSFQFAETLWEHLQRTSIVMMYGVMTEKTICHSAQYTPTRCLLALDEDARKSKKRKMTVVEKEELKYNGGPSTIAVSHESVFSATKCRDGFFSLADFVPHSNWALSVFPELEALYFACTNIGITMRQYRRETKSRHVASDGSFVQFGSPSLVCYNDRILIAPLQRYKTPVARAGCAMATLWKGEPDSALILFEFLAGIKEHVKGGQNQERPFVWLIGPLRTGEEESYLLSVSLKSGLGLATDHQLRSLILQDFPQPASSDLVCGKPYTFFVEAVPAPVNFADRENGIARSCKRFDDYIADLKTAVSDAGETAWLTTWIDKTFREQCVFAAVVYDTFASEREWQYTYVTRSYKFCQGQDQGQDRGEVCAGDANIVLSAAVSLSTVNEKRNSKVYQPLYRFYGHQSSGFDTGVNDLFVADIERASARVFEVIKALDGVDVDAARKLFAQDLEFVV